MQEPDADKIQAVNVESRVEFSTDLDALGVAINDATRNAWNDLRIKLENASGTKPVTSTSDLEPGSDLQGLNRVLGVGIGTIREDEVTGPPGSSCVVLYTSEQMTTSEAIIYAAAAYEVESLKADGVHARAVHTGPIDLLAHRFRRRPAPGGVSIAHRNVTAGTLGCLCKGIQEPRNDRTLVLSNNHVLANINQSQAGDPIYQPGPVDSGAIPMNHLGILERYVPINFNSVNYVDCATAWVDPDDVCPDLVYLRQGTPELFQFSLPTLRARLGMKVGKSGRTTQLTAGIVDAVGVTIRVNTGAGRIARFADQIEIRGLTGDFSRGGDSGSLIWTWDNLRNPVGLLFAGGGGSTFGNPIDSVLHALDVTLIPTWAGGFGDEQS